MLAVPLFVIYAKQLDPPTPTHFQPVKEVIKTVNARSEEEAMQKARELSSPYHPLFIERVVLVAQ